MCRELRNCKLCPLLCCDVSGWSLCICEGGWMTYWSAIYRWLINFTDDKCYAYNWIGCAQSSTGNDLGHFRSRFDRFLVYLHYLSKYQVYLQVEQKNATLIAHPMKNIFASNPAAKTNGYSKPRNGMWQSCLKAIKEQFRLKSEIRTRNRLGELLEFYSQNL